MTTTINASTSAGLVQTADTSGVLALQTANTTAVTIDANQRAAFVAGTAALPAITTTGDTNTGIWFPAADTIAFTEGGTESMRIDSSGNVMVATTGAAGKLNVAGQVTATGGIFKANGAPSLSAATAGEAMLAPDGGSGALLYGQGTNYDVAICQRSTAVALAVLAGTTNVYVAGNLLVAKTASSFSTAGLEYDGPNKQLNLTTSGNSSLRINRTTNDGVLVSFQQDASEEGNISVSGTTVSYNGGHLARYAQTITAKDNSLVKGTVLSNLDAMNVYTDAGGNPVPNEQLNKVKVSDVEGDANIAGVFVNWFYDEAHQVDEINMAMTGDMIIRIAQGVTVQRGDLLMSAGNGTAKAQSDDIVRSKTIAKVTSNHVTCTYADGSYCVPCVLMAC